MEKSYQNITTENRTEKYLKYFCEHGKYKYQCRECKGSQICPHNRRKSHCKECEGSQICPHNRRRSHCKECEGSQICPHNRQKQTCKECKGTQVCPHNRQKQTCKECKGTQVCPHNRQKQTCKECKGSQVCPHNKIKRTCKKCSDPVKVNIEQWIFNSRNYDKMNNIYDANRFIDKCFLKVLVEDFRKCYYEDCEVNLQYTEYQNDLATIERLNNSVGHIKSNCVLCCLKCNVSKKSKKSSAHEVT